MCRCRSTPGGNAGAYIIDRLSSELSGPRALKRMSATGTEVAFPVGMNNSFSKFKKRLALPMLLSCIFIGCAGAPKHSSVDDSNSESVLPSLGSYKSPSLEKSKFFTALNKSSVTESSASIPFDPRHKDKAYRCKKLARGKWSPKKRECTVKGGEIANLR